MTPARSLRRAALWTAACGLSAFLADDLLRHPPLDRPWTWANPLGVEALIVALVWAAFWEYRTVLDPKLVDDLSAEPGISKATGIQLFVFGLAFLCGAFLGLRKEWDWKRVGAVLVSKEFRSGRVILSLEFQVTGQQFTSRLIRAGNENSQQNVLEGSRYEIIYNPKDPSEIETVPREGKGGRGISFLASLGVLGILFGFLVYDESG